MAMTDVMQKIRDGTSADAPPLEDPAAELPDQAAAAEPGDPSAEGGFDLESLLLPAADEPGVNPGAAESAFVVEPERAARAPAAVEAPAPVPARKRVVAAHDTKTRSWDSSRVHPALVAFHDRYSVVCEQYRAVRARLLTMNTAQAPQIIAVTSALPGEGKTVSAANLALIMAEAGEQRIALMDADCRQGSLAGMLGIESEPGLADVLRGSAGLEAALQDTPLPNLKLLPAGKTCDSTAGELLGGANAKAMLETLRNQFDYVFIDTPPVATVSDVCLLAPHCDGAILVVQMHRTPEPTAQQAVRTLQANNVKILGCVPTRHRDRHSRYYGRYYYYYRES